MRVGGRYLYEKICDEQRRLAEGWTYEPPTFYDANDAALACPTRAIPFNAHSTHAAFGATVSLCFPIALTTCGRQNWAVVCGVDALAAAAR